MGPGADFLGQCKADRRGCCDVSNFSSALDATQSVPVQPSVQVCWVVGRLCDGVFGILIVASLGQWLTCSLVLFKHRVPAIGCRPGATSTLGFARINFLV